MTTISIELEDERVSQLRRRAEKNGVSVEEWLRSNVETLIAGGEETATDSEFETVARRAIERDAELLHRLAQ